MYEFIKASVCKTITADYHGITFFNLFLALVHSNAIVTCFIWKGLIQEK